MMKKLAKKAVAAVLGWQVRRLSDKNDFKTIGVVGSIGKTSTKLAIANVLSAKYKVQHQDGNYNHIVTAPLVFFGEQTPSLFNPIEWLRVFWRNERMIRRPYPYDVVVLELGTDGPGQISEFKKYLDLEIGVLTSITPEHMEFFVTLDEVAREELAVSQFSSLVIANKDFCPKEYLANLPDMLSYAIRQPANYMLSTANNEITINSGEVILTEIKDDNLSQPQLYSMLAAAAVAYKLGMPPADIQKGVHDIQPISGRMRKLAGINSSIIIDDSYNSSPEAVKLALDSLYKLDSPQKIAVLGNMNELGAYSQIAHTQIGNYCDPKQLSCVITIGPDANKYLAAAAEAKGCRVQRFDSPYKAGEFLRPLIKYGAAVLVKGSQNKVFAEESIKSILADPSDAEKLVRQSRYWISKKQKAFKE